MSALLKEDRTWSSEDIAALLQHHTYEEIRAMTGWSRGAIYAAACKHQARKNEARIAQRNKQREEMQREFLRLSMNTTQKMDVLDYLGGIPDDSVSLVLTSPPYNLGKAYGDRPDMDAMRFTYYYGWLVQIISEMSRILKPGGTICLQVGQTRDWEQCLYPIDVLVFEDLRRAGLTYQSRIVWTYKHGLTPKSRLAERYETILVFSKGPQQTFNPNAARLPQQQPSKRAFKGPNIGKLSGHPFGAFPQNVWSIPPVANGSPEKTDHPCQFPQELARRAILLYSNAGDLVVDPFHGSGTSQAECIRTGREFSGADLNYEATRTKRLAAIRPDLVTMLPGVTDESVACWQAEAVPVKSGARTISNAEERDLFDEAFA